MWAMSEITKKLSNVLVFFGDEGLKIEKKNADVICV